MMGCKDGRCSKSSIPKGIIIVPQSLKRWPTKAKEAPSPHEVRPTQLDTNPIFQYLGDKKILNSVKNLKVNHVVWTKSPLSPVYPNLLFDPNLLCNEVRLTPLDTNQRWLEWVLQNTLLNYANFKIKTSFVHNINWFLRCDNECISFAIVFNIYFLKSFVTTSWVGATRNKKKTILVTTEL